MNKDKIEEFYNKHYKQLMFIPIIVFALSLAYLGYRYANTGEFISKDVGLSGGITATVTTDRQVDINDLEKIMSDKLGVNVNGRKLEEFGTGRQVGVIVEVGLSENLEELNAAVKDELSSYLGISLDESNYSSEQVGSNLGKTFNQQLITAVVFAFLFMSITVFITFRTLAPSLAVISAALMDIIFALAIVSAAGIVLTSAGIAAFLLVIGYSVDTDILLTTRAIKRRGEGKLFDRMYDSMKTGLTMTFATLGALGVGYFVSNSYIIKQMFLIIIIALVMDIFSTYLTNSGILKIYCDKKGIV